MGIFLDSSFKYVRLYSQPITDLVIYFGLPEDVVQLWCWYNWTLLFSNW